MNRFSFGPVVSERGVLFRLWAPKQQRVDLVIDDRPPVRMDLAADGWHMHESPEAGIGSRYRFILADGIEVPDPASRHQPADVHGPSEVVSDQFDWRCQDWRGRPWSETIIYQLHVGAFSDLGTFLGVISRLDHLRDLGVTAIQLMPIADFPGSRNWGYDGVLPYAPESSYGRPEDLRALIDAAHLRGMSVFLDVVYNHFGPDGNYLPSYSPIFTDNHKTPWGAGINFDGEQARFVRDFIIENALYWIDEFRVDGLRLDAVHAIKDDSREHLLQELARRVRAVTRERPVHLVVENEENDSSLLSGGVDHADRLYTAQWNDDVHHVLHVAMTGEDFGYYADYADDRAKIGRGLAEGFVFQGEEMAYRGSPRGQPSAELPPTAFISFIQNHDQIGNRAFGDRMADTISVAALRAGAAIYLLSPQIPMIFMGEEWASRRPFPFFCDFPPELNELVRKGRREELARLPGFDGHAEDVPDPTAETSFLSAKLDWDAMGQGDHAEFLALYRRLIELRKAEIVPRLQGIGGHSGSYSLDGDVVHVTWRMGDGSRLILVANLDATTRPFHPLPATRRLFIEGEMTDQEIGPWSVLWAIEEPVSSI
ncbi:malto-oligosyltrehalose trehalohydrolase [Rhizobium sp. RU36D]|uniref:malto-oligosyltrehalose trehalohydrolase n=1 Tax=Rhizobium sp. RU36D TaxID=1907415 RepID=UPI0009D81F10|nr:malto-oligosyltrehalose trehalohydrolase [Rhizobium sp. RU36D]SMD01392.1 maltooligosyl trehalose hydrolase [Rhizobium sp. RU36D]